MHFKPTLQCSHTRAHFYGKRYATVSGRTAPEKQLNNQRSFADLEVIPVHEKR